jgi:hypothetical protein
VEDLLEQQGTDATCRRLIDALGTDPTVDYDDNGAVGHVLHSRERQPLLPAAVARTMPVSDGHGTSGRADGPSNSYRRTPSQRVTLCQVFARTLHN